MEQIRTLSQLLEHAKMVGPMKLSVARAEDAEVMEAVETARKLGIATAILVGNSNKIKEIANLLEIDIDNYAIVNERGDESAVAAKAVSLVSSGQAQIFMKGMLETKSFLRHFDHGRPKEWLFEYHYCLVICLLGQHGSGGARSNLHLETQ